MRSLKETVCSLGVVVAFAWAVAMPSAPLWGQTVQGVITGTVFDASRRVVPNAAVKITNEETNISQALTTGEMAPIVLRWSRLGRTRRPRRQQDLGRGSSQA